MYLYPLLPRSTPTTMNRRGMFIVVSLMAFVSAMYSLVSIQSLLNSLTFNNGRPSSPTQARTSKSNDILLDTFSNSATGSSFQNKKIRSFNGKKRLVVSNSYHDHHDKEYDYDPSSTFINVDSNFEPNKCTRFAVLTTIFDPTDAISRVANMELSWCLVIVADTKTPDDYMDKLSAVQRGLWHMSQDMVDGKNESSSVSTSTAENNHHSAPIVVYLSVDMQKSMETMKGPFGDFVRNTPWNHFCRKNIGYLYAILHGAQFIFDFDDDNYIKLDPLSGKSFEILPDDLILRNTSVVMQGPNVFNHHPIMGASDSWARGFPIESIKDKAMQGTVAYSTDLPLNGKLGVTRKVGVIQYLADSNPDIDAIHRLSKPLPMTFSPDRSKPVLVPAHSFAPYNAQATVHTRDAMFAMLLPATVPGRVSDIWRGYFAQCIFADVGLSLVFAPPKIEQERNEHELAADFQAELALYEKSGKLVEFLDQWDSEHDTVPLRMEQLWIDLYEYGYIEEDDLYSLQIWLETLEKVGYEFPQIKKRYRNVAVMGQFNYADSPSILENVIFWVQKMKEHFTTVLVAGPFTDEQVTSLSSHSIEAMQGKDDKGLVSPLENHANALLHYGNNQKIDGVLYMHDDAMLNITEITNGRLNEFPHDDIVGSGDAYSWVDMRTAPESLPTDSGIGVFGRAGYVNRTGISFRLFPDGRAEDLDKKITNATNFFELMGRVPGLPGFMSWRWRGEYNSIYSFVKDPDTESYLEEDGAMLIPSFVQADFLFVPMKYSSEFVPAAKLLVKHGVFLEIAFNKAVDMTRMKMNVTTRSMDLCTSWFARRGTPTMVYKDCYNKVQQFGVIHPMKLSRIGFKDWSFYNDWLQEGTGF